jgi:hypothetical protein
MYVSQRIPTLPFYKILPMIVVDVPSLNEYMCDISGSYSGKCGDNNHVPHVSAI